MSENNTPVDGNETDETVTLSLKADIANLDTPEQKLKEAEAKYLKLKINGVDDAINYQLAKTGLKDLVKTRTTLEKKRKEIISPAREYIEGINKYAKDTTTRLEKMEAHLTKEVADIDNAIELAKQAKIKQRSEELKSIGYTFDGNYWSIGTALMHPSQIGEFTDEQWVTQTNFGKVEAKRLAAEKAAAETRRIAAEEKEKADKQALIDAKVASDKLLQDAMERIKQLEASLKTEPVVETQGITEEDTEAAINYISDALGEVPTVENVSTHIANANIGKKTLSTTETPSKPTINLPSRTTSPVTEPLPDESNLAKRPPVTVTVFDYDNGFNDCRQQIMVKLENPDKFTRSELIYFVQLLTPKKPNERH